MLSANGTASVKEFQKENFIRELFREEFVSAVSHEVTAKVLTGLFGQEILFNRINLTLKGGDVVFCVVPTFRANEAREFTREEVEASPVRYFIILIPTCE
jgi:hypothetical protein